MASLLGFKLKLRQKRRGYRDVTLALCKFKNFAASGSKELGTSFMAKRSASSTS